jgi:P27 family predicted phage terminase small subunit
MGNKRKPDALKLVQGTARRDRSNPDAPQASSGVMVAPDWLSDRACEIFANTAAILSRMGVGSPDDTAALAMLASRLEEVEICTAVIEDAGRVYERKNDAGEVEMIRARPEVSQRSEAMRHAQALLSEFGLTPAARSKVSVNSGKRENPFAALG